MIILTDGGGILFDDKAHKESYFETYKSKPGADLSLTAEEFRQLFLPFKNIAQTHPCETTDIVIEKMASMDVMALRAAQGQSYDNIVKTVFPYSSTAPVIVIKKIQRAIAALPSVKGAIDILHDSRVPVVVLTDAAKTGAELFPFLIAMGLGKIKDIISSKDVHVKKPDARFFDYALAKHGFTMDEAVFIAHDLDELKGAHDIGLEVFALNYDPADDLSFIPEDHKLKSFIDIVHKMRR